MPTRIKQKSQKSPKDISAAGKKSTVTNVAEFKAAYPDVYNSFVEDGTKEGVMLERKRIKSILSMKQEYSEIPQVMDALDFAVLNGTPVGKVQTEIVAVMAGVFNDPCKAQASFEESPPPIAGFGVGRPEMKDIPGAPRKHKEGMISEV